MTTPLVLVAYALILCTTIATGFGWFTPARQRADEGTHMAGRDETSTVCIGRFQLTTPGVMKQTGRSQSIYRVDVTTAVLPNTGVAGIRSERVEALRRRIATGAPDPVLRLFELQPGVPAAWYAQNPQSPQLRELLAVRAAGDHAVVAIRAGEADKREIVETLVRNLMNAYVPSSTQGFCVGRGAITSEPGTNEQTRISFSHVDWPDFELEFSTRTVREPDTRTYTDVEEEKEVVQQAGGTLKVLRRVSRTVGTLEGIEMRISVTTPGEPPVVRFTWHHPGAAASSARPMVNLVGTARVERQSQLEKVWEAMLSSLRPVVASKGK